MSSAPVTIQSTQDQLAGDGGIRRLAARWAIEATLVAETALHLGSGERGDRVDLPLLREVRLDGPGGPLLLGSSLAGALRERLCEALLGDRQGEDAAHTNPLIIDLFGGRRGDPDGSRSAVIAYDSVARENVDPEVRDGVQIVPDTGVARDHAKYDMEVWPPGTRVPIRLHLIVPADQAGQEASLLAGLCLATEGFDDGEIRLGARGRRGLGRVRLGEARAHRYPLGDDPTGWLSWLATGLPDRAPVPDGTPPADTVLGAVKAAWQAGADGVQAAHEALGGRAAASSRRCVIRADMCFRGGVLIGAPQDTAKGADTGHLHSADIPILSGTSVAGAVRQRMRRIAHEVRKDRGDAPSWIELACGTEPGQRGGGRGPSRTGGSASRLEVEEVPLCGGRPLDVTRVSLDPWTQGTIPGALFQEEPIYGARATVELRLRLPEDAKLADALCGLAMLATRDMLLGEVPFGGTTGVGRGAIRPGGPLAVVRGSWKSGPIDLNSGPDDEARRTIEGWAQAFREHPRLKPLEADAGEATR